MKNIDTQIPLERIRRNDALLDDITPDWSGYTQTITITFKPLVSKLCGHKNRRLYNYFQGRLQSYIYKYKKKGLGIMLVPELTESGQLHFHGYVVNNNNHVLLKQFKNWLTRNFGFILCQPKRSNWDKYIWKEYKDTYEATNLRYLIVKNNLPI